MANPSPPPLPLDPPFRGYIETTFDALLVFEAARRGMIPRVTRRLIERERGMVQSGAVFVFDEHESGIKRWTDGLVWSPSRILGNFLVYRETDKRSAQPPTPMSISGHTTNSPSNGSPSSTPLHRPGGNLPGPSAYAESSHMGLMAGSTGITTSEPPPVLGSGELHRPRSSSEGGGAIDRHRERQLVGSLTNSYKFKDGGLVKKTMSVTVNGFAQHMISYYSVVDVMAGKLRSPSTIPELASLEISPEYLHKQNFRFPPMIEVGQDGIARYRGEPEEPTSPTSPTSNQSMQSLPPGSSGDVYDPYNVSAHHQPHPPHHPPPLRIESPRHRSVTGPMQIPLPSPHQQNGYLPNVSPGAGSNYYDPNPAMRPPPMLRHASSGNLNNHSGAMRPGSSSRRFDPYQGPAPISPRTAMPLSPLSQPRRQSQSMPEYFPNQLDVKPNHGHYPYPPPPPTAPAGYSDFYAPTPLPPPHHFNPTYSAYPQSQPQSGRLLPREYINDPPSSSSSSGGAGGGGPRSNGSAVNVVNGMGGSDGWGNHNQHHHQQPGVNGNGSWEGVAPYTQGDWRESGQGTGVAQ